MDDVRLTISIRDQRNRTRVTLHRDIAINKAADKAKELTADASKMFKKEAKAVAEQGQNQD
jgi:hypothetical protein